MVLEKSMSPRTKQRMDNLVCCNTSGLVGGGLFRDKVIEIVVRSVKTKLSNLHMTLNDTVLDKSISSLSTISKVVLHDMKSMQVGSLGLQSSYDYIGDDAKSFMREKISEMDPFSSTRPHVSLLDKSNGLSPFSGMSIEKLERFVKRNKANYIRNHPSKTVLSSSSCQSRINENNRQMEGRIPRDIGDQMEVECQMDVGEMMDTDT